MTATVTSADVKAACGRTIWDTGNDILYDMCRQHPGHMNAAEIVAKVWLIGRSYAAAIERRKDPGEGNDAFYRDVVAPALQKASVDTWLASVKGVPPGNTQTLAVHKKLMDLFKEITGLEKRSLASKYLHFHVPDAFFIYDSRARQAIGKVTPRRGEIEDLQAEMCDPEYKVFVRRCRWLRRHVETVHGVAMTPRQIDNLLLNLAGDQRRRI